MNDLYNRIEELCKSKGINITTMCREAEVVRGNLSDLKMGRTSSLSAKNLSKISAYFGVTMEYLLGTETEKAPPPKGERIISDEEIKFALFGGSSEITDAMYDEVKNFAAFVKEREQGKQKE